MISGPWQRMGAGGQAFIWSWLEVPGCRRIEVCWQEGVGAVSQRRAWG